MCWDKRKISWNQPQRHLSFTVQEWNSGISCKTRKLYQETHPHPSLGDSRLVTLQSLTATGGLKWSWHQQCWDGEREREKKSIIAPCLKFFFPDSRALSQDWGLSSWCWKQSKAKDPTLASMSCCMLSFAMVDTISSWNSAYRYHYEVWLRIETK